MNATVSPLDEDRIPHGDRREFAEQDDSTARKVKLRGIAIGPPRQPMAASALPAVEAEQLATPRIGLQLPQQLSFETWLRIGRQLSIAIDSSLWCLGDWLAYGETMYNDRYRIAIERTCLDYQTLRNYAWVARKFSISR